MKLEWTDLGDGFQAWIVNDRPVIIRDTQATNPHIEDARLFRHDELMERIEGVYGWRVSGVFVDHQTKAVTRMATVHQVDYTAIQDIPMKFERYAEDMGKLCELTGIPSYSMTYRLRAPWRGHPAGAIMLWSSGYKKRPGVLGAIEQRSLESILAMTVQMIEEGSL